MNNLDALKALVKRATPGPWRAVSPWEDHEEAEGNLDREVNVWQVEAEGGLLVADCWQAGWTGPAEQGEPDAAYIAAANPIVVTALLDVAEASGALINDLTQRTGGVVLLSEPRVRQALARLASAVSLTDRVGAGS